jgi:hypothetical protein
MAETEQSSTRLVEPVSNTPELRVTPLGSLPAAVACEVVTLASRPAADDRPRGWICFNSDTNQPNFRGNDPISGDPAWVDATGALA